MGRQRSIVKKMYRNDLCYCKSTKKNGKGETVRKKYKECCWHKHGRNHRVEIKFEEADE